MIAAASDGTALWYDVVGAGPTVVLIPGRGDSTDVFPDCFVSRLIAAGGSVLRMDPRDSGLSGDGGDVYTMTTMADDVLAVMDAADVERADVLALSMGGLIATQLATRAPDRVRSITFLSAMSPDPDAGMGPDFFAGIGDDAVEGTLAAMGMPSEADRAWVEAEVDRARVRAAPRPEAGERHQDAAFRLAWPELTVLGEIGAPALVIHGSADRTLPVAHAQAFERELPNARCIVLEDMGHLPTRAEWDRVTDLVLDHLG